MPVVASFQVFLVGLEVVGGAADDVLGAAEQRRRQRRDQRRDDLVLDLEDVGHLPVVTFGPELEAGRDIDERGADAQARAGAADAAFDDRADAERRPDLLEVLCIVAEAERRGPRGDAQAADPRRARRSDPR